MSLNSDYPPSKYDGNISSLPTPVYKTIGESAYKADTLLCKNTWLKTPTTADYIKFCNETILLFFKQEHIAEHFDFAIYWSLTDILKSSPESKFRWGLSDIDIIAVQNTSDLIVDPWFIMEFEKEVVEKAKNEWIPVQIKWYTSAQMQNSVFAPGSYYIKAIKSNLVDWYHTNWIKDLNVVNNFPDNNPNNDELNMLRYFNDKIKNIWIYLFKVGEIIKKPEDKIDLNDQKILVDLWDAFKKIISITSTSILSKNDEYVFSSSDKEIINKFRKNFEDKWKDIEKLIYIFEKINNIKDWYIFLKQKEWRCRILWQCYNNFIPFINAIWEKLNNKPEESFGQNIYWNINPKLSDFSPELK